MPTIVERVDYDLELTVATNTSKEGVKTDRACGKKENSHNASQLVQCVPT